MGAERWVQAWHAWSSALQSPYSVVALVAAAVAAALIVVSTLVKTILPLRWLAVGSNAGFIAYGLLSPSPLVLALHSVLLPLNLYRAFEMRRLVRRVRAAAESRELSGIWLRPYMRRRRFVAGDVVFSLGQVADQLYFLIEGHIELVERGRTLEPGQMFGEIAFFAPDRKRTSTARCTTDCVVLTLDESTFRQLYYQNPEFGFEVVRMIAARLTADVRRLEAQHAPDTAAPDVSAPVAPAAAPHA